ncbi:PTS sugar transporter subunit IIA [Bacillus smithii]|uniref:PTS system, glucose subfamily, IIA component n=1 Tax=Bacillus smithii 7_3_47FAA TaxID=665952 RepID=G9QNP0_9BACI|nr:PTS glucose transporter subunit IIA [Bacillus smithii]EHL75149.1 PTS system, glucose subfamily, IIA component [Bacillus smithii 7_3_47FAA]
MFKWLFWKKGKPSKEIDVYAPVSGKILSLEEVPDPVFSEKMMGDGMAVEPIDGRVVAPFDGDIMQIFPTKHAVGIKAANGAEILIHVGLETVSMKGEGFESHVSQGDKVKKGDLLITFDLNLIREKANSTITPIIVTNGDMIENIAKKENDIVTAGEEVLLTVTVK